MSAARFPKRPPLGSSVNLLTGLSSGLGALATLLLRFSRSMQNLMTIGSMSLRIAGHYLTTEAENRKSFASIVSYISEEKGLELVREACSELDEQVKSYCRGPKATEYEP